MTTFEEYFEEHHLPLIFDDGDIELLSGYRVGHAYYDEFEEYLPILNVLKPSIINSLNLLQMV